MRMTLKAARVNRGFTQADAAAALGVSVNVLSNWERGITFPDAPQIKTILEVYGVGFDQLIFCAETTV